MPHPAKTRVPEAPAEKLPALLTDPPWSWEPIVLEGLAPPATPTAVTWRDGARESFLEDAPAKPAGKSHDWNATAERIRSGQALTGLTTIGRTTLYTRLVVHGPHDLAAEALEDRRYWDDLRPHHIGPIVARHDLAAYPLALHATHADQRALHALVPFLDAEVARLMIEFGGPGSGHHHGVVPRWADFHGPATVPFVLPYALSEPGPRRSCAENALRRIIPRHGHAHLIQAARPHGAQAVRAMEVLRHPMARPHGIPLDGLPQILLRDRQHAMPAHAVEHFVTMMLWAAFRYEYERSEVEKIIDLCDPGSLAEFAWELYVAEFESQSQTDRSSRGTWASDVVRFALERLGDDTTATRLAAVVARWSLQLVRGTRGTTALRVFTAIGSDAALRRLHWLGREATDRKLLGPGALEAMREITERRGLTEYQVSARLIPDFGLDADGGKTLNYGSRGFRVGFDEQLRPYVIDEAGRHRTSLPKPGAKDDAALATAAREHFAEMRKETRAIAADQINRLEEAMVTGSAWTVEEFRATYLDHPLLWHIARRLVWSVGGHPFRIAEDRSLADADDGPFSLPPEGEVSLPHPFRLGDAHRAWSRLFADYEILQPFHQLGRPVFHLTEHERAGPRLTRFEGAKVANEALLRLPKRGWEWPGTGGGGRRWIIQRRISAQRAIALAFAPGIVLRDPASQPLQKIDLVELRTSLFSLKDPIPLGELDPVAASEILADLTELTDPTGP